ncbi:hypothetical protein J1N35_034204 [Gossypium stocksii]|uniref:RNase H type-1 domain-containing protein n=1 Tax=Gossypium stocksii TaxID=47602 RepID=A0A9D3ZPV1_9ROSI|nr:hypothetical protein J1N35_034204 [Gossypium stocksii]
MLLKDLYELNSVERVKVFRNSLGKPVGSKARLLAGYLGIIARNANLLPINYESWHHMPDSNKNQALDNIKERFALEVSDSYVKKALGKKWRDHKSALKKEYFKKNISLEDKLRNVPLGMLRYQWEDVVRSWNSKKGETNKSSIGILCRDSKGVILGSKTVVNIRIPTLFVAEVLACLQPIQTRFGMYCFKKTSRNGNVVANGVVNEGLKRNESTYLGGSNAGVGDSGGGGG